MDIENLSFLTEITDEDASHVNGGYIQDISGGLLNTFNNMYDWTANVHYAAGLTDLGDFWTDMEAVPVIPTDFGVL